MAEVLAVLGAIAAASQITQQCIIIAKIITGLYSKIPDAPNSIRSQIRQVEQLVTITSLIERNTSLQTDLMASALKTCLETTRQLLDELSKISTSAGDGRLRRVWRGLAGLMVEERLQGLFAQLEQRKSSLAIYIGTIDAALLQSIQSRLSNMQINIDTIVKDLPAMHDATHRVETSLKNLSGIAGNVSVLPNIDGKVTTLYEELIPAFRALQMSQKSPAAPTERNTCFSVPFERDLQFVGREDILTDIARRFESQRCVVLAGIGGVGKSQVAIEYSYRFQDQHPNAQVFWIYSSNISRIQQAYKDIAMKLDLPGWDDPKVNILQLVSGWLSGDTHGPWLLIFDNADDKELFWLNPLPLGDERTTPLLYYLPRAPNGSTLITTRDKRVAVELSSEDDLIEILPMTDSEAKELLSKRLRRKNSCLNDISSEELCKTLEYLPLAITQAAAFISKSDSTVDRYLKLFRASDSEMQNLLSKDSHDRRRNLQDSDIANSVIRAWKVSFDQIIKQDSRASEILSLMAVLDGQGIPEMLLNEKATNQTEFVEAVGTLKAFSFISEETRGATFIVHRLVQVSTRKWLDIHGEIAKWQEMALNVVTDSFPFDSDDVEKWTTCEALLPHVKVVLQYTYTSDEFLLKKQAEILHKVSSYNFLKGQWVDAYQKALKAYQIRDEILGSENPLTLTSMCSVAQYLFAQSKFEGADNIFQQHLNLAERILGFEHQETLRSMAFVASIKFYYKGQFSEGEESYRRTLALRKKALGLEHPDTLTCMANLGLMLRRQGKSVAAVEMHREALTLQEKVLGYHHPDTLVSLDYLSQALTALGDHKTAEEMCRRALQSQESRLGPKHPKTFQITTGLAHVLSNQMRYEDSEKMYRQVLAIREEVLGRDHRDTIMNLRSLGWVLERQGKFEEAEGMYRKSLTAGEIKMGSDHPDTIDCLESLVIVLRVQGKPDAEAMTWKLLELQERKMGVSHEATMLTIQVLASQLENRQDYFRAEEMFWKLMELRKQVFGLESDEVIRVMRQLMFNLGSQGKPEKALEMGRSLLELQIRVFSNEHPETIKTLNNSVSYLNILGRQKEAEDERQKSLELQEKILDDDHPNSITKLNRSAQSLENEGKYEDAIATYQTALRLQSGVLGGDHAQTVSTILDLQRILGYTGSELDLPHGRRPRILWLSAPERLVEFSSRYPTRCNPHSRLLQTYQHIPRSGQVQPQN